jgi:hypothetical protein
MPRSNLKMRRSPIKPCISYDVIPWVARGRANDSQIRMGIPILPVENVKWVKIRHRNH